MKRWSYVLGVFIVATQLLSAADVLVIAENGEALADIVVGEKPSYIVAFAAQELKGYLDKITGGDFKITHQPTAGIAIRLGQSPEATAAGLEPEKLKPDGFLIHVTDRDLFIVGQDNPTLAWINRWALCRSEPRRGTLMGVYTFLEQLGVRWPAPGPANECVPRSATLKIPVGLQTHEPVFTERTVSGIWNFMNKVAPEGV